MPFAGRWTIVGDDIELHLADELDRPYTRVLGAEWRGRELLHLVAGGISFPLVLGVAMWLYRSSAGATIAWVAVTSTGESHFSERA